jgi:hypothetical protein
MRDDPIPPAHFQSHPASKHQSGTSRPAVSGTAERSASQAKTLSRERTRRHTLTPLPAARTAERNDTNRRPRAPVEPAGVRRHEARDRAGSRLTFAPAARTRRVSVTDDIGAETLPPPCCDVSSDPSSARLCGLWHGRRGRLWPARLTDEVRRPLLFCHHRFTSRAPREPRRQF